MGMFAFRRMREREAASTEVASFPIVEPKLELPEQPNGHHDRSDSKRRKLKQLPNAG